MLIVEWTGSNIIFLTRIYIPHSYICCPLLCFHCGLLLQKCSTGCIGFNGAETNCGIAHILGILMMNSCNTVIFLATTIIWSLSTLNRIEPNLFTYQKSELSRAWEDGPLLIIWSGAKYSNQSVKASIFFISWVISFILLKTCLLMCWRKIW